jgi:DNA-binding FadR family transcriptional regulator
VPRHVQIADVLRQRIRDGKLAPRMPIPSEPHLTQEFGVARDTARKAVAIPREQGYVHRAHGGLILYVSGRLLAHTLSPADLARGVYFSTIRDIPPG